MHINPLRAVRSKVKSAQRDTQVTQEEFRLTPPLVHVSHVLTGMVASILQVSGRKAQVALGAGLKVAASTAAAGAVSGLVGSFGAASTGTAIASLYGAAKSTATLYWIGSIVGGGAAAGGVILVVGGAGAGLYAAHKMRGAILGGAREEEQISEHESRVLAAIASLKSSIDAASREDREITPAELRLFASIGLAPLTDEIDMALRQGMFDGVRRYHRIRLRGQVHTLRKLQKQMEALT